MYTHLSHLDYPRQALPKPDLRDDSKPRRAEIFRYLVQAAVQNWRRRKMIAALQSMNDHLLRDIGIERHNIKHLVDGFDARELRMAPVARNTPAGAQESKLEAYRLAA